MELNKRPETIEEVEEYANEIHETIIGFCKSVEHRYRTSQLNNAEEMAQYVHAELWMVGEKTGHTIMEKYFTAYERKPVFNAFLRTCTKLILKNHATTQYRKGVSEQEYINEKVPLAAKNDRFLNDNPETYESENLYENNQDQWELVFMELLEKVAPNDPLVEKFPSYINPECKLSIRDVLKLHLLDGFSLRELSKMHGIGRATLYRLADSYKAKLQKLYLQEAGIETG